MKRADLIKAIRHGANDHGKILRIRVCVDFVTVTYRRGKVELPITEAARSTRQRDALISALRSTFDVPVVDKLARKRPDIDMEGG